MTHKVFVYGTLMYPRVMNMFLRDKKKINKAQLKDHFPYRIDGAHFPGLKPKEGSVTDGLLINNITPDELRRLDSYEGEGSLYNREEVVVRTESGEEQPAFVYIFNHSTLNEKWTPDEEQL